jgi:hypothetical protein
MKNRIPVSGIIIPLLYVIASFYAIFFSTTSYEQTFNVISIFDYDFLIIQIGVMNLIYALIMRRLFTHHREVYINMLGYFALFEFIMLFHLFFLFYEFRTPIPAYGAIIRFSFFYLLMYERRLFRK